MDGVTISAGSAADIPRLEPLWVSVHHQHQSSMPALAPYVSDETTWRERRALYEELFSKPDTFLLLATDGDDLVAYALVHMIAATDTWTGDTWVTGNTIAELESIAVAPSTAAPASARSSSTPSTSNSNAGASTM